jgi:pimeloyl-ACP methyl ester carboxylesterase
MKNVGTGQTGGLMRLVLLLLVLAALPVVAAVFLVHSVTQPPTTSDAQDPGEFLLAADEIALTASDGVTLSAWFIKGRPGAPPIVLCHDLGGSRSDLLNAAVILNKAGYPLLLLDFRRHGKSAKAQSTLGIDERLDILAAVQYLKGHKGIDTRRLGGWGVGMGAYALALAALETPEFKALALDSIGPDIPTEVDRRLLEKLPPALAPVVPALHFLYNPYFRAHVEMYSVRDRLIGLEGRNLLFIGGSESPEQFDQERLLYEALPEGPDGGKNLLELRRSGMGGLYADDRRKYDETILGFFATFLETGPAQPAGGAVEVIER